MKITTKSSLFSLLALGLILVSNQVALAASKCTVNGREVSCEELGEQVKGFLGWGIGFLIVFFTLGILLTVFWIMMLVHAAKHDVENKAMWIILIVFTGVVGALIYYFAVKRKFNKQPQPPLPSSQTMAS